MLVIENMWYSYSQSFDTQFVDRKMLSYWWCTMASNRWKTPTQQRTTFGWHAFCSANSFPHSFCEKKLKKQNRLFIKNTHKICTHLDFDEKRKLDIIVSKIRGRERERESKRKNEQKSGKEEWNERENKKEQENIKKREKSK